MSKGHARRPSNVTQDEYAKRWDETFSKKESDEPVVKKTARLVMRDDRLIYEYE